MEATNSIKVQRIDRCLVEKQKWKPEQHTVSLKDDGEWWGCISGEILKSVVCVSDKHGGKYFSEVYTPPEYRRKGYCTLLLKCLANEVYGEQLLIAHCLKSSVGCFWSAGFRIYKKRYFKHGDQYYMKRKRKDVE